MRKISFCQKAFDWRDFVKRYSRQINYYETDQMGVVHHSNYIRFFEEARLKWMEEIDLPYHKLEEIGIIIPVTFVECQYKIPVRFGETVEINTSLAKFDGIKMEFTYEVVNPKTEVIHTTGRSGHCFVDSAMKPVLIRKKQPKIYQTIVEALREDGGVGRKGMIV
jgi:acyl-CoA thioester hydrolase